MDAILHLLARAAIALLQALPLRGVARLGRAGGELAFWFDARHRRVAILNLAASFPAKPPGEIRAIARENFRRIGENFAAAVKTAVMSPDELRPHFEFVGAEKIRPHDPRELPQSRIVAIGHFGNFELNVRFGQFVTGFRNATTFRGLRQPTLNRLLQSLRERANCEFFDRRTDAAALRTAMSTTGLLLGLLADQHAGDRGLRLPFLGRDCSTSTAPAVFALRYRCPLHTAICHRLSLAHWRIEVGDEIPILEKGGSRTIAAISADINHAFETAIRRDPANWFWVHNRWKEGKWRRDAATEPAKELEAGEIA